VVEEDTESGPLDSRLEISILEDDVGRLSSQLEGDLLQVGRSSSLHDLSTNRSRSSEGDLSDLGVLGDGRTDDGSISVDDVDNTLRKSLDQLRARLVAPCDTDIGDSSLFDQVAHPQSGQGGELGRLHDDDVSGGQCRTDLPGEHQQGELSSQGHDTSAMLQAPNMI